MASLPQKRSRCDLTVRQKKEICDFKAKYEAMTQEQLSGYFSQKWNFHIARRTVGDVLKRKADWERRGASVTHPLCNQKRIRKPKYEQLDEAVGVWVDTVLAKGAARIHDATLVEKAREFAARLRCDDFMASPSWLGRFKARHGMLLLNSSSSSSSTQRSQGPSDGGEMVDSVASTRAHLQSIASRYAPRDVYCMCAVTLRYRLPPGSAPPRKGSLEEEEERVRRSRERITVALCTNADGSDRLKPLVVAESALHPSTLQSTLHPSTPQSTLHPSTSQSTLHPSTPQSTLHPSTPQSTLHPSTPQSTLHPSIPQGVFHPGSGRGCLGEGFAVGNYVAGFHRSRKAWMSGQVFAKWLRYFDGHVKRKKNRPVLLLLDRVHSHIAVSDCPLQCTVVHFLPPHVPVAHLHPLEAGGSVLRAFKAGYRRSQLQHLIRQAGEGLAEPDVRLRDAIRYLALAWSSVAVATIVRGWMASGAIGSFRSEMAVEEGEGPEVDPIHDLGSLLTHNHFRSHSNMSAYSYIVADATLQMEDLPTDDDIVSIVTGRDTRKSAGVVSVATNGSDENNTKECVSVISTAPASTIVRKNSPSEEIGEGIGIMSMVTEQDDSIGEEISISPTATDTEKDTMEKEEGVINHKSVDTKSATGKDCDKDRDLRICRGKDCDNSRGEGGNVPPIPTQRQALLAVDLLQNYVDSIADESGAHMVLKLRDKLECMNANTSF